MQKIKPSVSREEVDTPEQLEYSILWDSIPQSDKTFSHKISIRSRTVDKWLPQKGYYWVNIQRHIFIGGLQKFDVVEYHNQLLKDMEAIKFYLVKFQKNISIKSKVYLENRTFRDTNQRSIIFIRYDKNSSNADDGRRQVL